MTAALLPAAGFADVAQQGDVESAQNSLDALRAASDISAFADDTVENGDTVSIESDIQSVEVEKDAPGSVCVESSDEGAIDFSMELPVADDADVAAEDGAVVISDEEADYSVAVEALEGSVRSSFIVENVSAPETYDIDFDLPQGVHLRFAEDIYGDVDGSIEAYENDGDVVMAIDAPWAVDAQGEQVATHYDLNGDRVTQIVEHAGRTDIAYPVVADPLVRFSQWFESGKWEKVSMVSSAWEGSKKKWTLKLVPTWALKLSAIGYAVGRKPAKVLSCASANAAWTSVNVRYRDKKHWTHSAPMKEQFYCHFYLLVVKRVVNNSWFIDLEPSRPSVGINWCVLRRCNP